MSGIVNLTEFDRGRTEMCQTIRRMILINKADAYDILQWCEDFLHCKEQKPEDLFPLGYNPYQE